MNMNERRRVLITGMRAPVALDLARQFRASGWTVFGADSLRFPMGRFSQSLTRYFRVPAARDHFNYSEALRGLVKEHGIDLLLPTCEEAFYIARHFEKFTNVCDVAVSDWPLMQKLHDKSQIEELTYDTDCKAPETIKVESYEEAREAFYKFDGKMVLKRAFSRFARDVRLVPSLKEVETIKISSLEPWVCQPFIEGQEYCLYAVACHGKLTAVSAYKPSYRLGGGSSYYFSPILSEELAEFASKFCEKHGVHGQVSFDLIYERVGKYSVIECNPRAISAVHLFDAQAEVACAFTAKSGRIIEPLSSRPKMIGLAMVMFGLSQKPLRSWLHDWRRASDVAFSKNDLVPFLGQLLSLGEALYLSLVKKCDPISATTYDLEWNGESLD